MYLVFLTLILEDCGRIRFISFIESCLKCGECTTALNTVYLSKYDAKLKIVTGVVPFW